MSNNQYVHSCYIQNSYSDTVIVSEIDPNTNKRLFNIINNPERPVWVTRPPLRIYNDKKEYELESNLDQYRVKNWDMPRKIAEILGKPTNGYCNFRKLCNSPWVHGADIAVECLVKMAYKKKQTQLKRSTVEYNVGMLDIETSVLGGNEICIITFIDGHRNSYTAIYNPFMQGATLDEATKVVYEELDKFYKLIPKKLLDQINTKPFKFNFFDSDNELEIFKWIFDKIHMSQVDFIGIWNMGFDIPRIIDRIQFRQGSLEDIMCHPDIPKHLKTAKWLPDKSKVEHFTDRWDWFLLTAHAQFIDSMCLYSRIRKVKGRDISYTLDYISSLILGTGKLDLGNGSNHYVLQTKHFLKYIAYNIVDVILLILMEELNQDISVLCELVGNSRLSDFNKQTVQLKNMFYEYCRGKQAVPGVVGSEMKAWYDEHIANSGGAVLSPALARNTGVAILEEYSGTTALHKGVLDIDVSSQYPSIDASFNIAKETKLSTCIDIEGFGIPHEALNKAILSLVELKGNSLIQTLDEISKFITTVQDPVLMKVITQPLKVDDKTTNIVGILKNYNNASNTAANLKLTVRLLTKGRAILASEDIGDFFTNISAPVENSVHLCTKFFGLPSFTEMEELISA